MKRGANKNNEKLFTKKLKIFKITKKWEQETVAIALNKDSHCKKVENIEDAVLEKMKNHFKHKAEINVVTKKYDGDIELLQVQLKKYEDTMSRIKMAYQNGIDTLVEYKANKEKVSAEILKIENRMKELSNSKVIDSSLVKGKIENVYNILVNKKTDMETKYISAHELINKMVYNKKEEALFIFYNNF